MIAYHNDPGIKAKYLERVRAHRAAARRGFWLASSVKLLELLGDAPVVLKALGEEMRAARRKRRGK
jgi:hypothetical protein